MRVLLKILLSTVCWVMIMGSSLFAQKGITYPQYQGFVNDYLKVLSITESQQLETYLVELAESTSNEIVVAVLPTPEFGDFRTYTNGLAVEWGIGQEGKNNGVLLAIFPNDRKIVIEVGYGLEGAIPDIAADNIISKDISPAFRAGSYYQGILQGTKALGVLAKGEISEAQRKRYYAPKSSSQAYSSSGNKARMRLFVIIFIIVLIIVMTRGGNGNNNGGGYNRRGRYRGRSGGWFIFPTGGGGWGNSGGSSWGGSGGFGGGGGFGGFGGGDFGGGGAMGDW